MEFTKVCEKFDKELEAVKISSSDILERSTMAINLSHNFLRNLRVNIQKCGFENKTAEINFFKKIKQIPLTPLIYYSEIRSFEIQFPKGNIDCQRKHITKKINKMNQFFLYHLEFGQYIDLKHTHFDEQYYTRDFFETYHMYSSNFYFQDPDFSTSRDMLLGKFNAFTQLVIYLNKRLHSLKLHSVVTETTKISNDKLMWPFTNTDWVELVYALSSAGVKQKNRLNISNVSKSLEETFDYIPKDLYRTYQDIKNRKNSKTIFLDSLTSSLLLEIKKSEE